MDHLHRVANNRERVEVLFHALESNLKYSFFYDLPILLKSHFISQFLPNMTPLLTVCLLHCHIQFLRPTLLNRLSDQFFVVTIASRQWSPNLFSNFVPTEPFFS